MTANTLSNKDRAKVASEVTGKLCVVAEDGVIWHKRYSADQFRWMPEMSGNYTAAWQRSQALALVEWLADKLMSGAKFISYSANIEFIAAIEKRDIVKLESMAHQMITKGKQDE